MLDKETIMRLQKFRGVSKLKKAAMNMLVKMADQNDIEDLRKEFQKLDKDGSGLINAEELKTGLKESKIDIPDEEIDKIIQEVDYFGNGQINYTEFLMATMDTLQFLDTHMLQAIFS